MRSIKGAKYSRYDDRWIDHRERELFQAYYQAKRWADAKRIVESSLNVQTRTGRKGRLAQLAGKPYDQI